MVSRTVALAEPVDLRRTLGPLTRRPVARWAPGAWWSALRTPAGPATVRVTGGGHQASIHAWGPGAEWVCEHGPGLVGAEDDAAGFVPRHDALRDAERRVRGLRLTRSRLVFQALVPVVLEQKVQSEAARRSYASLVRAAGEAPPRADGAPPDLRLPPSPEVLARTPPYALHRHEVEQRRAVTVVLAARNAAALDAAADLPHDEARRRLEAIPGIGRWTSAEVALVALGDGDAVPLGDYHFPNIVSWALAGEARGDDARMLELLEPYRGHRGRVIRLLVAAGVRAPAFGPRLPLRSIRAM